MKKFIMVHNKFLYLTNANKILLLIIPLLSRKGAHEAKI